MNGNFDVQSNLCTTTTLGTQKLLSLLTGGRCSDGIYVLKVENGHQNGGRYRQVVVSSGWTVFRIYTKTLVNCGLLKVWLFERTYLYLLVSNNQIFIFCRRKLYFDFLRCQCQDNTRKKYSMNLKFTIHTMEYIWRLSNRVFLLHFYSNK